jgi:hypothetical protein
MGMSGDTQFWRALRLVIVGYCGKQMYRKDISDPGFGQRIYCSQIQCKHMTSLSPLLGSRTIVRLPDALA